MFRFKLRSCACNAAGRCRADSVLSVEKLSKAVPFLRCPLTTGLMIMEQIS